MYVSYRREFLRIEIWETLLTCYNVLCPTKSDESILDALKDGYTKILL